MSVDDHKKLGEVVELRSGSNVFCPLINDVCENGISKDCEGMAPCVFWVDYCLLREFLKNDAVMKSWN